MRFFERAHIKDAIAFLKIVSNPHDSMAWMRVLTMQEGIGPAAAGRIISVVIPNHVILNLFQDPVERGKSGMLKQVQHDRATPPGMTESMAVPVRAQRGGDEGQAVVGSLRQADVTKPAALVQKLLASSYKDYLETTYPNAQERIEDLEQFAEFASSASSLTEFLSDVSLVEDIGVARAAAEQSDEERMILSTIHQAKGLEWHTVFVIHLVEDAFPNPRALRENGGEEEERRLFYVAATRAKKQLILTYPLSSGVDYLVFHEPSRFLTEVSPNRVEELGIKREDDIVIELDENEDRAKSFLPSLEDL